MGVCGNVLGLNNHVITMTDDIKTKRSVVSFGKEKSPNQIVIILLPPKSLFAGDSIVNHILVVFTDLDVFLSDWCCSSFTCPDSMKFVSGPGILGEGPGI